MVFSIFALQIATPALFLPFSRLPDGAILHRSASQLAGIEEVVAGVVIAACFVQPTPVFTAFTHDFLHAPLISSARLGFRCTQSSGLFFVPLTWISGRRTADPPVPL